jgi:ATP-dependent DNA helicase RecQ
MDSTDLNMALQRHFGFSEFRGGQEAVVRCLLEGRSALAVFPTGGGKSLCYQLPALLMDGLTLVVSPLIALMKDQVDVMVAKGIAAARLDSTLTGDETVAIYDRLSAGKLKLLYVAPERLANEGFLNRLRSLPLALLAIDEAHCISEWGHNFRPDYLKLEGLAKDLKFPRVLGLTATATPTVSADILRAFDIRAEDHTQLSFHRSNLDLHVTPVAADQRNALLLGRLKAAPEQSTIVYVTLQHTAESVATFLQKAGQNARAYHAGLPSEVRADCQESFMSGRTATIVATIAFGMGIDKSDIRAIYHYNLPKSLENFTQEIGRAGRDGKPAVCEMLACGDDLTTLENFAYGDTPTELALRHLVDHLMRQGKEFDVSFYQLSTTNDIRPLVVSTLMTYLELEGVIQATRPFYSEYRVQYLRDLEHLLKGYTPSRQEFLRKIFAQGKKGWSWITLKPSNIASQVGESQENISKAITSLEQAGDLRVKPSGIRQGYRLLRDDIQPRTLADRMLALFQRREQQDINRLHRVVTLAEHPQCLTQFILHYFGEPTQETCGHCSRCEGNPPQGPLPRSKQRPITLEEGEVIQYIIAERLPPLRSARQLTRFLCGLSSPAAARARLSRRDEFALLQDLSFRHVLDYIKSIPQA